MAPSLTRISAKGGKKETKKSKLSPKKSSSPQDDNLPVAKATPLPSKLKRFRINVPSSMDAGDIMTIKLDEILTKILITAPTSSKNGRRSAKGNKQTTTKSTDHDSTPPSPTLTSCSNTTNDSSMASSIVPRTANYADITSPEATVAVEDTVIASSETTVPKGKMMMEAKPVVVVHAFFRQHDKELKEKMVDEVMKQIIQETVDCGCNSILGLSVSIKAQKAESGFLVKASGTPCSLLPVQVSLLAQTMSSSGSNNGGLPLRQRTSSVDDDAPPLLKRRQ